MHMNEIDPAPTPFMEGCRYLLELQLAGVQAWSDWMEMMVHTQEHLLAEQAAFLAEHHPHRRWHKIMPSGPDLKDHYGHRAQDVDVERI